jgi:hypothetical protein
MEEKILTDTKEDVSLEMVLVTQSLFTKKKE